MSGVRLVHILSENWTLTPPRDLRALVRMAQEAEDAGFDAVMVSEHVVLGRGADAGGLMPNPRDYALPGNQDPAMPWPSSLVLLSAIAAATTRLSAPLGHAAAPREVLANLALSICSPTGARRAGVHRARCPVRRRRAARRAPGRLAGSLGTIARVVRGRHYRFGTCGSSRSHLRPRGAPVVRLEHPARPPPPPPRPLRARLESPRPATRRRSSAARADVARDSVADLDGDDPEQVAGFTRSASSRRSSSTTRRVTTRGVARWSPRWPS